MINSIDYIELEEKYGAHNYHPLDVVLERGEGVWVYDVEGNRYLDCLSAYSALNQGHVHPRILEAMMNQARQLTLTSRAFRNVQLPQLYKELSELTGYEMALPMNSGAEAVETALKIARKWAYAVKQIPKYQAEIIVAGNNFHGRTISVISFSTEELYKSDFGPFTPGFIAVEYGNPEALEQAITPHTAAVLIEPIQGEAGVIIPPAGYLAKVREICKRNRVLMIADEIQTGLGRTGRLFACDHESICPDMVILGKALSGGFYPVSAVIGDQDTIGLLRPGEHGSTFGGSPLAAAIARESLKVIVEENLIQNAETMGNYIVSELNKTTSDHVKEIRGKGLLIGIELKPEARGARRFCEVLKQEGLLAKETHENVIRIAPPLIIDRPTVDWAIGKILDVLQMP
ncbi:ornithine--oxo-acid aminotransferase [Ornatilinea apprima]|uniref:ornithine aminotransferase n=1 Tax=Ornatilinea apprima TaxID=1134406 RepID=A0A0N8GLP8_9CHLR|nr:ornithine--oxo-acid transaminase [Ornatilinea apprima]KPL73098.1 ornithine--oxo-acid aminotransferase [Ornatilinea apprima]